MAKRKTVRDTGIYRETIYSHRPGDKKTEALIRREASEHELDLTHGAPLDLALEYIRGFGRRVLKSLGVENGIHLAPKFLASLSEHDRARAEDIHGMLTEWGIVKARIQDGNIDRAVFHAMILGKLLERVCVRPSEPFAKRGYKSDEGAAKAREKRRGNLAATYRQMQKRLDEVRNEKSPPRGFTVACKRVAGEFKVSQRALEKHLINRYSKRKPRRK